MRQVEAVDSLAVILAEAESEEQEAPVEEEKEEALPPIPSGQHVRRLEYEAEGRQQLEKFFSCLKDARRQRVRILHFGDSQIEGDRVSSYIRSRLQKTYSGRGVGMLPVVPPLYPPYGLRVTLSSGWKLLSIMPANRRQTKIPYGILGSTSVCCATVTQGDTVIYRGYVDLQRRVSVGKSMGFTRCRIMYRALSRESVFSLTYADTVSDAAYSAPSSLYGEVSFKIPPRVSRFRLSFHSPKPIEIYALSLETPTGIQVDNIPFRGSSGSDFSALSDSVLSAFGKHLSPRLVLLQFGVNVVPGQLSSYSYYTRLLRREIARLQRAMPTAAFVLLGVSDMGVKEGAILHSYPNIPLVKGAQRKAAFEQGIAFWDMAEAMGGENAIVAWVNAAQPLATRDYVHFTPRGARLVGELFYAALMAEYADYVNGGLNER